MQQDADAGVRARNIFADSLHRKTGRAGREFFRAWQAVCRQAHCQGTPWRHIPAHCLCRVTGNSGWQGIFTREPWCLQAGTLSGNPLAMVAGIKTLEILDRPGAYEGMTEKTKRLTDGLLQAGRDAGHEVTGGCISGELSVQTCTTCSLPCSSHNPQVVRLGVNLEWTMQMQSVPRKLQLDSERSALHHVPEFPCHACCSWRETSAQPRSWSLACCAESAHGGVQLQMFSAQAFCFAAMQGFLMFRALSWFCPGNSEACFTCLVSLWATSEPCWQSRTDILYACSHVRFLLPPRTCDQL